MKVGDLLKRRAPFKREGVWMVVGVNTDAFDNTEISLVCPDGTLRRMLEIYAKYSYTVLT